MGGINFLLPDLSSSDSQITPAQDRVASAWIAVMLTHLGPSLSSGRCPQEQCTIKLGVLMIFVAAPHCTI